MRTSRYRVHHRNSCDVESVLHVLAEQQFATRPGRSRGNQRVPDLKPVTDRQIERLFEAGLVNRRALVPVGVAPHDPSRGPPLESTLLERIEQLAVDWVAMTS